MKTSHRFVVGMAVVAAMAVLLGLLYSVLVPSPMSTGRGSPPETTTIGASPEGAAVEAVAPPAPAQASAATATFDIPADAEPLTTADIAASLERLLGRQSMLKFMQVDDFARRIVATVDNLGREHAPTMLWPVQPTEGRFTVMQRAGAATISPDNGLRYAPFVLLIERLSMGDVADLYVRMYPLLQDAYTELGFPNRSFHRRLMEVIDLLLATPEPSGPIKLDLLEIKGPISSLRPWVHHRFADPALESLTAGQKLLIRAGPVNERRLKAQLVEFRRHLVQRAVPR